MNIRKCIICEKELNRKQKKCCSEECRINKLKTFGTSHHFTEESRNKLRFKRSEETREKNRLGSNVNRIKKEGIFCCDRCNKIYETNTSLRAHKSSCGHEKIKCKCEICEIEFNSKTGLNIHINSMHKKSDSEKEIMSQKMKEAKLKESSKIRKTSKQEDNFYLELKNIFFEVERNFKIKDFYHVYDFYIPKHNLIIEFDGDFWHGNPDLHFLSKRMKKQYMLDENSFVFAKNNSYNIMRIWSSMSSLFLEKVKECLQKQEKLELIQLEEVVRKEFTILA
jgi:very-short-patch-repair endonuclease